jgi:predicted transcriptional regulator
LTEQSPLLNNPEAMKPPRFLLRGFRRPSDVAASALGPLERQTLEEVWRRGETSVRDIFLAFEKQIAYTTLMTTLDRLYKKRLLRRRKDGRAFLYSALVTNEELEQSIAEDVIDGLLGQKSEGVEPILACIVDTISDNDRELLNELDRLIKQKRRDLEQKD